MKSTAQLSTTYDRNNSEENYRKLISKIIDKNNEENLVLGSNNHEDNNSNLFENQNSTNNQTNTTYVALSRCPLWDNIQIPTLSKSVFIIDQKIVKEYQRLENLSLIIARISHGMCTGFQNEAEVTGDDSKMTVLPG
ncbi:hypothetical protein Glove_219g31 [Diversispora epigaea]|uniref:Uncharacterized protein n=1 Tax=Diversispora epigaea TaxID=1348612 RepID=A0A397IM31_9GLOM|nr:hypothetical protein Glove_219g31 [Diversispora epigaea]